MAKVNDDGTIDVLMGDISDAKGSMSWFGELTFGILLDQNQVIDMVVVMDVRSIFTKVVLVSEGLMVLAKVMPMSEIRCGHDHVTAEGELSSSGL